MVFIGDVMGHGLAAAAAMAHVRAATRAYLALDPEPASVVSRLDAMFQRLSMSQLVTLTYLILDPATGQLRMVNAGQPKAPGVRHLGLMWRSTGLHATRSRIS